MPSTIQRAASSGASHFRLRQRARTLLAGVVAISALSGCGGGEGGPAGPAAPTLALGSTSAAPLRIVSGVVTGRALPASGLRARVGGDSAIVTRFDDSTLTLVVPQVAAGAHLVTITMGNDTLTASLQVTTPPIIADPTAWVGNAFGGAATAFDEVEASIPLLDAEAVDTAMLRADVARARVLLDSARRQLAQATPAQRALAAQFLAANAAAYGLTASGADAGSNVPNMMLRPELVPVNGPQLGLQAPCVDSETGQLLLTYEECSEEQRIFSYETRSRLQIMFTGAVVAAAFDLTIVGAFLGVAGTVLLTKEFLRLTVAVAIKMAYVVVAKVQSAFDLDVTRAVRMQVTTTEPEPEYFVAGRGRALRVIAEYRSLQGSDATLPGIGPRVRLVQGLETVMNAIRGVLREPPMRPLIPATARRRVVSEVPHRYLDLSKVSPSAVTGTDAASDTGLVLRFTRPGISSDVPFTFDLNYAAPGLPVQSVEYSAVLMATARFMARTLASGKMGDSMCAFDVTGASYCWGRNAYGRLGDLTTTDRAQPTRTVTGPGLTSLTLGDTHTCGLTATGVAHCWGYYALGDTTRSAREGRLASAPVRTGFTFSTITAGRSEVCGLNGGRAVCWGAIVFLYDTAGTNGRARIAELPNMLPFSPTFTMLDVGSQFACGVTSAQLVECFGSNRYGQLGDGSVTNRGRAVVVAGGRSYKAVSVGEAHACALTTAGAAYCWGGNTFGQIGDRFASADGTGTTRQPSAVSGGLTFAQIESGANHTCALTSTGKAYCWGDDVSGQSGSGTATGGLQNVPAAVATNVLFRSLSAGRGVTCGIALTGGGVYCWGSNNFGEAGIGAASTNVGVSTVLPPLP